MEQLLLVTSCDSPAGIGASLRTDNARTTHAQKTDGHTDVTLEIQSLAKKLDFLLIQFGKHAVALVLAKVQTCFIPNLKALKVIYNFQCQTFRKL